MDILVIGIGYVGLITAACFSEMGHNVTCLDINQERIENLKNGKIPIYEPGLKEIVKRNTKAKRLSFTTNYEEGVKKGKILFIAVPTPSNEDGSCNTQYVEQAAKSLAKHMDEYKIIVNKSTVPVGTGNRIEKIIQEELKKRKFLCDFDVVSNPEFLKEGCAIADCMKPDRIIIGSNSQKAIDMMKKLYAPFTISRELVIVMDIVSAELTKYSANAMLASRISFMNEISKICKQSGADINQVRKGIGSDSRIGYQFLYAGIGFGGSCFPKDVKALIHTAKEYGCDPILLDAIEKVNQNQKEVLAHHIKEYFSNRGGVKGKTIAVWGLSFKPDTDDMREAPSLIFIKRLLDEGAILRLYDPIAMNNAKKILGDHERIIWCNDEFDAANCADGIALLTEWKQFRRVDFSSLTSVIKGKVMFDGRNQYESHEMKKNGFDYIGIGVPEIINNEE